MRNAQLQYALSHSGSIDSSGRSLFAESPVAIMTQESGQWLKRWEGTACAFSEQCSDNSWSCFNAKRWWSLEECQAGHAKHLVGSSLHASEKLDYETALALAQACEYVEKDVFVNDDTPGPKKPPGRDRPQRPMSPVRKRSSEMADIANAVASAVSQAMQVSGGGAGSRPSSSRNMRPRLGDLGQLGDCAESSTVQVRRIELQRALDAIKRAKESALQAKRLLASASNVFSNEGSTLEETELALQSVLDGA